MQVNIEKNTNRKYYRIELPAQVNIENKTYSVKDWSLGGFMLENVQGVFEKDWEGTTSLMLPFDKVVISVEVTARAVWVRGDRAGFSFIDISTRVKNILKSYLKANIEGNLGEIDGILAYVDAPEIPLPTEHPLTPQEEKAFRRGFYSKSALYWMLGLLVLAILIISLLYSSTNSTSLRAIVAMPKVTVNSPYTGKLAAVHASSGETVKRGQLLASLDDQEIMRKAEVQQRAIEIAEKELEEAQEWLALAKQGNDTYSQNTLSVQPNVAIFETRVAIRTARVEEEQARLRVILGDLEKTRLISPCDGVIYASKQTSGSGVRQGDELFIIQPDSDKTVQILAKFTFEDARGIYPGNTASVYIPSLGKRVSGTVQFIGFQALNGAQSSSSSMEISLNEVPISILLSNNDLPLYNGTAVVVTIRTPIIAKLRYFL